MQLINRFDEIGSEYWKADRSSSVLNSIPQAVYTASGRSAQSLVLTSANIQNRKALLPAYTCQHIVEPFAWNGWEVVFYDIGQDLTPVYQSFDRLIDLNPGCIIVEGYYSFPTAKNIIPLIEKAQNNGAVIIEDITHSFLNDVQRIYDKADYEFCSLRKWSGLSDGGFAVSLKGEPLMQPLKSMDAFSKERHEAREIKREYVETLNPETKNRYLEMYGHSEEMLDGDIGIYSMSSQAYDDFIHLDLDFIKKRRRENFNYLLNSIKSDLVKPIFKYLPKGIVPIMFPIIIPNNRDEIRSYLIKNRIYCPVHWPAPIQLDEEARCSSKSIYDQIMSIPCDQRYDLEDMKRLVDLINNFRVGV